MGEFDVIFEDLKRRKDPFDCHSTRNCPMHLKPPSVSC